MKATTVTTKKASVKSNTTKKVTIRNAKVVNVVEKQTNKPKKVKNSINWQLVLDGSRKWKEGSIFRVLDFLNECELVKQLELSHALTIGDLKALCPEYMTPKVDKKGNQIKRTFSPFPFLKEMRKIYGIK